MDNAEAARPPSGHFHHGPRWAQASPPVHAGAPFRCTVCDFVYYFNPAVAAGAIVRDASGRGLLVRRAHEPAKGKLALPDGFIDAAEGAEDGLRREIREEVNLEVGELRFLGSEVNRYTYRDVVYPVVDLFFLTTAASTEGLAALDGVASAAWH